MRLDMDEHLALMPIESDVGETLLAGETFERREQHWHLLTPDGRELVGGEAGVSLMEQLRPTRYVGRALRVTHMTPLVSIADWAVGRLRPYLWRVVPHGHAPKRYP